MKRGLIITGGTLDLEFAGQYLKDHSFDCVVSVDGGLKYTKELGVMPHAIVGDFDTFRKMEFCVFLFQFIADHTSSLYPNGEGLVFQRILKSLQRDPFYLACHRDKGNVFSKNFFPGKHSSWRSDQEYFILTV